MIVLQRYKTEKRKSSVSGDIFQLFFNREGGFQNPQGDCRNREGAWGRTSFQSFSPSVVPKSVKIHG